jgi:cell division protein FtsW (lipid II flippase)
MKQALDSKLEEYLNDISNEMTFSEARESARAEIRSHIEEHIAAALSYGLLREEAIQQAFVKVGDPRSLGVSLNQVHRPRFDFILPLLATTLSMVGVWNLSETKWIGLQLLWVFAGLLLMTGIYLLPVRHFRTFVASLYGIAVVGLAASYFSGISYDGQPYLKLAGLSIKIVDVAGSLFALGLSSLFWKIPDRRGGLALKLILFLAPLAFFSANGFIWSGMLLLVSGLCLLGMQKLSNVSYVGVGIVATGMLLLRFTEGLSLNREVTRAVVENAHTDYAFRSMSTAIMMELLAGCLFVALLLYGTRTVFKIKDRNLRSIAVVCISLLGVQVTTTILANIGALPMISAGMNVPFISYGGSGLIASFMIVGVIVACLKRKNLLVKQG